MGNHLHIIRAIDAGLFLLGTIVFGAALAYIQLAPLDFERRAQSFILHEIETEIGERLSTPSVSRLKEITATLSERFAERIEEVEGAIAAGVPQFIAAAVAAMCRLDCENRAALEAFVLKLYEDGLARFNLGYDRLRAMVEDKYRKTLAELRHDIAIFLTGNLVAMTLGLALTAFRGKAARHLLPIASLLGVSTLLTSYWYIFRQDWIFTIIYADYYGWSYLVLLGAVLLLLVDIALNRARVTTEAFNALLEAIGSALSLSPC